MTVKDPAFLVTLELEPLVAEAHFFHQGPGAGEAPEEHVRAHVDLEPLRAHRPHAPARMVGSFDNLDVMSCLLQAKRGGETRDPGADDCNLHEVPSMRRSYRRIPEATVAPMLG